MIAGIGAVWLVALEKVPIACVSASPILAKGSKFNWSSENDLGDSSKITKSSGCLEVEAWLFFRRRTDSGSSIGSSKGKFRDRRPCIHLRCTVA